MAEDVEIGPFAHLRPGLGDRRALPDRQLRRGQEEPPRGGHPAASLQLPRRRRGRRERERRRRIGDGQLRRDGQAPHRHRRRRQHRRRHDDGRAGHHRSRAPTTGAGSVVTRDVAPGKKVVGVPARPIELKRRSARSRRHDAGDPGAGTRRPSRPGRIGTRSGGSNKPGHARRQQYHRQPGPIDLLVVVILILVGGFFAASEIALITVKRHRLSQLADDGQPRGAHRAAAGRGSEPLPGHDPDRDHLPRLPGGRDRRGGVLRPPRGPDRAASRSASSSDAADAIAFVIVTLADRAGLDHHRRAGAEDAGPELPRAPGAVRRARPSASSRACSRRSCGSSRASAPSSSACWAAPRSRRAATCRPRSSSCSSRPAPSRARSRRRRRR